MEAAKGLILTIDAGGTGTRAELRRTDGTVLGRGAGGPGNLFQNRAGGLEAMASAWREAAEEAGFDPARAAGNICLSTGVAGLSAAGALAAMRMSFAEFGELLLSGDGYAALIGAFGGGPGALLAIGTGVVGCALDEEGRVRRLGGWGFPAGDRGGGAWLGLQLLGAWLEWRDGIGPASPLWEHLSAVLPDERPAILDWMARARSAEFAALARPLAEATGDPVAEALLDEAAIHLACLARALLTGSATRLALSGGLAPLFAPRLAAALGEERLALEAVPSVLAGAFLIGTGRAAPEFP
jgi:glucosamine kinase